MLSCNLSIWLLLADIRRSPPPACPLCALYTTHSGHWSVHHWPHCPGAPWCRITWTPPCPSHPGHTYYVTPVCPCTHTHPYTPLYPPLHTPPPIPHTPLSLSLPCINTGQWATILYASDTIVADRWGRVIRVLCRFCVGEWLGSICGAGHTYSPACQRVFITARRANPWLPASSSHCGGGDNGPLCEGICGGPW